MSNVLLWSPPHMAEKKQDDQLEHTYSSYVKTRWRRWTIGRSGKRGSGISVLAAPHDDYNDIYIYIYKQDLALNNLQWLTCHRNQPTNQHIYIHANIFICLHIYIKVNACIYIHTHTHTHTHTYIYIYIYIYKFWIGVWVSRVSISASGV